MEVEAQPQRSASPDLYAYLEITRTSTQDAPGTAEALGAFARGASESASTVLRKVRGLSRTPDPSRFSVGGCTNAPRALTTISEAALLELVEADQVALVEGGTLLSMVPRAFPRAGGSAFGALYTTATKDPAQLATDRPYRLIVTGMAHERETFEVSFHAPQELEDWSISGVPLKEFENVDPEQPLDLSWTPAPAPIAVGGEDPQPQIERWVLLELNRVARGGATPVEGLICLFVEADGVGSVPQNQLAQLLHPFSQNQQFQLIVHQLERATWHELHGRTSVEVVNDTSQVKTLTIR